MAGAAAVYLGLAIVTGETLQVARQTQTVWDYAPRSGTWGGHCTVWVGYPGSPDYDTAVSWGQAVQMTRRFVSRQGSDAWFVVTQAYVDHPSFRAGVDLAGFAAAYTALTGRPFPAVTPTPAPDPTPVPPAPDPGSDDEAFADALRTFLPAAKTWLARTLPRRTTQR